MPTSTKTRLELINSVLLSIGERPLSSSGGTLGSLVTDCVKEALIDVSMSAKWNELRDTILGTWSGDRATLNSRVVSVQGVTWYTSPTGSPAATYDYNRYPIQFVTLDEYLRYPLTPYTNSAQNRPRYWTLEDSTTVRVNPYPNDATERNKISFDCFLMVQYPTTDSSTFSCSDQFLNVVQYKASALLAMKFISDGNMAGMFEQQYNEFRKKLLVNDTALPSGGYSLYRNRRR